VRLTGKEQRTSGLALKGSWPGGDMEKVSRTLAVDRENAKGRELRL
jgi:hypothetical protein